MTLTTITEHASIASRIAACDWAALTQALDAEGYALLPPLLSPAECAELIAHYDEAERFRSRIDMARHRFGEGEYKYFANPLPTPVQELREQLYPRLAPVANAWQQRLGAETRYPAELAGFLDRCHAAGQSKPTPLQLRYEAGGYNCLHQDIYGAVAFPFQVVFMLTGREEYRGGELLLVEQRPRAQSQGRVITLEQGEGLIFTTRERPIAGSRGWYRANVRHGVSRIAAGVRATLGIIFHDAA
ncbi:MAG TPA: 2OG-Fe(II) oxygenase [Dehalococcoidia bacterium]|nr:2OG-Fe(II) oxygenase [Dehalococcoidia bacterium]